LQRCVELADRPAGHNPADRDQGMGDGQRLGRLVLQPKPAKHS
jgi:hypothetical protein